MKVADPRRPPGTGRRTRLGTKLPLASVMLTLVGCLIAAVPLAAQERRVRFESLSLEDGLSQADVYSVLQDGVGFLWIGTQDGLNQWNGYEFRTFRHDESDPRSLSHNFVYAVLEDRRGVLWVGTLGGGLNAWSPSDGGFDRYTSEPADPRTLSNDRVRVLLEDRSGSLWIGTDGGGLNRLHPPTGLVTRFAFMVDGERSVAHDRIRALWQDSTGLLWVGTDGGGLLGFDVETETFLPPADLPFRVPADRIRGLYEDRRGRMWIGTYEEGLYRYDPASGSLRHFVRGSGGSGQLASDRVRAILQDEEGLIWVGTDQGLSQWNDERQRFLNFRADPRDQTSLSDDRVLSIHQDRGGVLWFGTMGGGLSKWNPASSVFATWDANGDSSDGLTSNTVTSFSEATDGAVWVGTYGGGLNRLDPSTGAVTVTQADPANPQGLGDDRIMALFTDSRGDLWVGTRAKGLQRMLPDRKTFESFRNDPNDPDSLSRDAVTVIDETEDGSVWVGTFEGGLDRFDRSTGTFEHFRHKSGDPKTLGSDRVIALESEDRGVLWIGTEGGGLSGLDLGTRELSHWRHDDDVPQSLSDDTVFSILRDQAGNLWIGTQRGLNRWDLGPRRRREGIFRQYGDSDALRSAQVFGILEDSFGMLWLTTNDGLLRLDPDTEEVRRFDTSHGLAANEFNSGAYARTSNGSMYVGGNRGFDVFQPSRLNSGRRPSPVVVTRVLKLNEELPLLAPSWSGVSGVTDASTVELSPDDYVLTFEFAALDFAAPASNRYAYRLDGFDKDWVESGNQRRATYTNLAPGHYQFRVRGANNFGVWNELDAPVGVIVVPPWWRTGLAYLGYAAVAVLTLVLYSNRQAGKLQREAEHSRRLEQLVLERTSELAERNEELQEAKKQFEEASLTDPLTELRNRRYLMSQIDGMVAPVTEFYEIPWSERQDEPRPDLAFFTCDLDNFKRINDLHGHEAGNRVLVQIARLLRAATREGDMVIRWGGDEFLVVGRCPNAAAAQDLAERIRSAADNCSFMIGRGAAVEVRVSVGWACYPFFRSHPESIGWEHVVGIADRALYVAKQSGSNAWVGILGTQTSAESRIENLVVRINEHPEELLRQDLIEVRSSLDEKASVVLRRA